MLWSVGEGWGGWKMWDWSAIGDSHIFSIEAAVVK
jgi:hypothetical protein